MRFHTRLFLALLSYSVLLVGAVALFQYRREKVFKAEELNQRLQMVNDDIFDQLADSVAVLRLPRSIGDLRVTVVDRRGHVVFDNSLDTLPGSNHLNREEIAKAMTSGEGYAIRRNSASTGKTYFYSAKREGDMIVRTAVPYSVELHKLLAADYAFLWFIVGISIIMCVIGYLTTRRIGGHISRLNRFAEQAERGENIVDTESFPDDELGEISGNIIRLYTRLREAMTERDRQHRLALEQEHDKIRIKRELTNNINHELKTPVAAVEACLESLADHPDMSADRRQYFVGRALDANRRLRELLADVSAITRIEDGGDRISREPVDIAALTADVCAEFSEAAIEKNIVIDNGITLSEPISGNSALLESVMRNLIDNVLKYSGATRVELRQNLTAEKLTITVTDNGCGVSPEHLPHLFERFYRVDKGRSRRCGGTGLGLAIVKNAVIWHGGHVRADLPAAGGLRITIVIPR